MQLQPGEQADKSGDIFQFDGFVSNISRIPLALKLLRLPADIDAAFVWSGNNRIYFTKGKKSLSETHRPTLQKWKIFLELLDTYYCYTPFKLKSQEFELPKSYDITNSSLKIPISY